MSDTENPLFIGVDIGGTNIRSGVVSPDGTIMKRLSQHTLTHEGKDRTIERLLALIQRSIDEYPPGTIKGIGIGAAGAIDIKRGVIVTSPNIPGFKQVALRDIVFERFSIPAVIDNDANAAAYGEFWAGSGKGITSLIVITLGTGVGGGIILDGLIWHGSGGMAGEIGHMTIVPDGRRCRCGNQGCLEAYASATAIVERAKELIRHSPDTTLLDMIAHDGIEGLTSLEIFHAALNRNQLACEIFREMGKYLGVAIASLLNILNPEMVILGGQLSGAWDLFHPTMEAEVTQRVFDVVAKGMRIVPAGLGDDAGIIGAGGIAAQEFS